MHHHGSGRRSIISALALGVLLLLAGCSPFGSAPPPDGSSAALRTLLAELRHLDGVASVRGDVRQADPKDRPDEWLAVIEVAAASPDLAVAEEIRAATRRGVPGATVIASLTVPGATGSSRVLVDPTDSALVALAEQVRREPGVESTTMTRSGSTIDLGPGGSIADTAADVRSLTGSRVVTIVRADTSIEVTATSPGPALLDVVVSLADDPDVAGLRFSAGDDFAAAGDAFPTRPSLTVTTRDPQPVASRLSTTTDEAADAHLAPRASFDVRRRDSGTPVRSGWIGLPPGSPSPHDDTEAAARADEPWVPVDVGDQTETLRTLLGRSIGATGIGADVTTRTERCATPGSPIEAGTRAVAQTVIPVFTVHDDAQASFDAVTEQWTREGLRMTDRAMGRDTWTGSLGGEDLVTATIRGTTDGLSLIAESRCVG